MFDFNLHLSHIEEVLDKIERQGILGRIWQNDYSVWKPYPSEISNRLGWLTITELMKEKIDEITFFAEEIRQAGFRDAVLLGMGGSSLGPEVLKQTFGTIDGYPRLTILDSTSPEWIRSVCNAVDPAHTLFIVSSKSGTTTEPISLFHYFTQLVESAVGQSKSGDHFIAITDPDTPLVRIAQEQKFRRTFLNPPDIGGRYSVLSYFGLVPAALSGIDIARLLKQANAMKDRCAPNVPVRENPGAWLGAAMGTMALQGRDKLTIVTSPLFQSFGLWVEQLIAESTGKEGKGIIPIAGEPLVQPSHYDNDRLFVYLRMEDDDDSGIAKAMIPIRASQYPVIIIDLIDNYDLGAEFFRWEFATAVAGSLLGINPFDQPDVQSAKTATEKMLNKYVDMGNLPLPGVTPPLPDLLSNCTHGDYLSIMAYTGRSAEIEQEVERFRRRIMERYSIATTFGYGPRFLHSTGQLHKGGSDSGIFLQLTVEHGHDLPVPGAQYTFGTLIEAQAAGDLQTLQSLGRRVSAIRLYAENGADISTFFDTLIP